MSGTAITGDGSPSTGGIAAVVKDLTITTANAELGTLLQKEQYVGETWEVGFTEVSVQIHDKNRQIAGGIPMGCFLIATRLVPGQDIVDWNHEDAALILLRVKGGADLWNAAETTKIRIEAGQRATDDDEHWDAESHMDAYTNQAFAYGGIRCSVLGTYYLKKKPDAQYNSDLMLTFGSDIANFYPHKGLKVYKPTGQALQRILNFRDAAKLADHPLGAHVVPVGRVRYSSTERANKGLDDVKIYFSPVDLLGAKTALFGMTRVGKSNTTKVIAKSVYELRTKATGEGKPGPRVGQIIFDVNGEYANENFQDVSGGELPTALRNVWKVTGSKDDVVVYGQRAPKHDPGRRITKINFFAPNEMLQVGKELINGALEDETAQYARSFIATTFADRPADTDRSAKNRFDRAVLAYHVLLKHAGFTPPDDFTLSTKGLFSVTEAMERPHTLLNFPERTNQKQEDAYKALGDKVAQAEKKPEVAERYFKAATVLKKTNPQWSELHTALEALRDFLKTGTYKRWNEEEYVPKSSTQSDWHDERLKSVLDMFQWGAYKVLKAVDVWHEPKANADYVDEIYALLEQGALVIIDQSLGDPELNKQMAERIARRVFNGNANKFATETRAEDMPILIYVEEAHNILPDSTNKDVRNIWSRLVKEGGKFGIGVVYATQEPSSIQHNILKNTANWFVGYLSSTDEGREVSKHFDFKDYEASILNAQDRGFMRVRMLSNGFTVPVQIDKFTLDASNSAP